MLIFVRKLASTFFTALGTLKDRIKEIQEWLASLQKQADNASRDGLWELYNKLQSEIKLAERQLKEQEDEH